MYGEYESKCGCAFFPLIQNKLQNKYTLQRMCVHGCSFFLLLSTVSLTTYYSCIVVFFWHVFRCCCCGFFARFKMNAYYFDVAIKMLWIHNFQASSHKAIKSGVFIKMWQIFIFAVAITVAAAAAVYVHYFNAKSTNVIFCIWKFESLSVKLAVTRLWKWIREGIL